MEKEKFQIKIPEAVLLDLDKRLKNTRWPDELKESGWDYGTNLTYLKKLVDYWQYKYEWKKQETKLNKFAQFKTDINGIKIHFIHEHGRGKDPLPIILTHGWPDSYLRFEKII